MEHNSTNIKRLQNYCLGKPLAYEARPFGEFPICYRLMGKIFAQFHPESKFFRITLKCKPDKAEIYRSLFPGIIVRGYHCPPVQQPYWNTINLELFDDMELLLQMIDEAYMAVADSFSRKAKAELAALSELEYILSEQLTDDFLALYDKLYCGQEEKERVDLQKYKDEKLNLNNILQDLLVVYSKGEAVACAALKMLDEERAEIVHLYTEPAFAGLDLEAEIVRRLEAKAQIRGYKWCLIRIDKSDKASADPAAEAFDIYKKAGYRLKTDDGLYPDLSDAIYMERKI